MKFFNINQTIAISAFSLMMLYAPAGLTQNSHSFGDIAARLNTMICQGAGIDCNSQVQVGGQVLNHVPGNPLSQPKIQEILKSAIGAFLDESVQRVAFDFSKIAVQDYQCSIMNPYKARYLNPEDKQNMEQSAFEEGVRILDEDNQKKLDAQYQNIISSCAGSVASDLPVLLAAGTAKDIPLNTLIPQTYQCISRFFNNTGESSLEKYYQDQLNHDISPDAEKFKDIHPNNCEAHSLEETRILDIATQGLNSRVYRAIHDYATRIPMPPINHQQPIVQPLQEQPTELQPQSPS